MISLVIATILGFFEVTLFLIAQMDYMRTDGFFEVSETLGFARMTKKLGVVIPLLSYLQKVHG